MRQTPPPFAISIISVKFVAGKPPKTNRGSRRNKQKTNEWKMVGSFQPVSLHFPCIFQVYWEPAVGVQLWQLNSYQWQRFSAICSDFRSEIVESNTWKKGFVGRVFHSPKHNEEDVGSGGVWQRGPNCVIGVERVKHSTLHHPFIIRGSHSFLSTFYLRWFSDRFPRAFPLRRKRRRLNLGAENPSHGNGRRRGGREPSEFI